jgi:CRP-like cAMP-binding protein
MMLQTNALQKNRLLAQIPQEIFDRSFSDLPVVSLYLKQVLYEVGDPLEYVYFVEQGIVSLLATMTSGSTTEVGMIGREGLVGLPFLLGDDASGQQVLVQAPGTALRMPASDCKAAFDQSAAVRAVMLHYMAALFQVASQTAACNQLHSLRERSARWLLMMYDRLQADEMPLTHEFLSSMLGVRRTRVTETAGELQRSGMIVYSRGLVTIVDIEKLKGAACECYRDHDRLAQED